MSYWLAAFRNRSEGIIGCMLSHGGVKALLSVFVVESDASLLIALGKRGPLPVRPS